MDSYDQVIHLREGELPPHEWPATPNPTSLQISQVFPAARPITFCVLDILSIERQTFSTRSPQRRAEQCHRKGSGSSKVKSLPTMVLPVFPFIGPLKPLVPSNFLLTLSPAIALSLCTFLPFPFLLFIDLNNPIVLASLVGTLVPPFALPLTSLFVVSQVLLFLGRLGLDALLCRELLPGCLGLGWW